MFYFYYFFFKIYMYIYIFLDLISSDKKTYLTNHMAVYLSGSGNKKVGLKSFLCPPPFSAPPRSEFRTADPVVGERRIEEKGEEKRKGGGGFESSFCSL